MLNGLIKYIENRNWSLQREGEKFLFYKPPIELGFDETYLLPIPKIIDVEDFNATLSDTIKFVAEVYEVDPNEITHDVTNYFEILKKDAIYFKLNSENLVFQKTLEVNDIWSFLKNLSTSYTNYIKIEFAKNFYPQFGADTIRVKKALSKILDLAKLRVVALEYHSFGIGVSTDNFMGKNEIEIKEIQEWRAEIIKNYKKDVIGVNFNSIEEVEYILNKFNEDERRKIFDPLVLSINNSSDYSISITDSSFTRPKKLKRIPSQTVDILVPKEIGKEIPKRKIGLYRTILPIDENKSAIKIKISDIEENSLFTEKLEEIRVSISQLTYKNEILTLKKEIKCQIKFNEHEESFVVYIENIDTSIRLNDLNDLQHRIDDSFSKMIDFYYFRDALLDKKGDLIRDYLFSILPEDFKDE